MELPVGRPRGGASGEYGAARFEFQVPTSLVAALRALQEPRGVTLFMALLAAFQALLYRYTGQDDIRVGVPVAGRRLPQTHRLVGLFVNTVVCRARIARGMTLAHLLQHVRETVLEAQAHQDLPFEQLVEALSPPRMLSHTPLFQVLFNHLPIDLAAARSVAGLNVELRAAGDRAAQFELTLETREDSLGRVRAQFLYAAELFAPATLERLSAHYLHLLEALSQHPERPLGDFPLVTGAERAQIDAWSHPAPRPFAAEPVHRLFERQVRRQPDAPAVVCGEVALSYASLNRRANQLAHHLIRLGVRPDCPVGVMLERSTELVVALLAILKAGGAYVPLDAEYPPERLRYMLEDSGVGLAAHTAQVGSVAPARAGSHGPRAGCARVGQRAIGRSHGRAPC